MIWRVQVSRLKEEVLDYVSRVLLNVRRILNFKY